MIKKKKLINGKIRIYELFFFISYFLFIFSTLCSELQLSDSIVRALNVVSIIFSFFAIFKSFGKTKISNILLSVLFCILSAYLVLAITNISAIIFLFVLSVAAKKIQLDKLIKVDLLLKILLVFVVMTASNLGFIQVLNFSRAGEARNSLGFHHPNFAGLILLNIYSDIIYLRKNKKLSNLLIGTLFIVPVSSIIDSRNAAIGIAITSIIQLIPVTKLLSTNKKRLLFPVLLIAFLTTISLFFTLAPLNKTSQEIDKLLSGRITYSKAFYEHYGINMLGNKFEKYGSREYGDAFYVLDNGYIYLLVHTGIIVFALIMLIYISRIKKSLESESDATFAILVAFACVGLMEQAMFQPIKNPFILSSNSKKEETVKNQKVTTKQVGMTKCEYSTKYNKFADIRNE